MKRSGRCLGDRPPTFRAQCTHAMGALEAVARDVTGDEKATLGDIIQAVSRPARCSTRQRPLEKIWGFASNEARHVVEGRLRLAKMRSWWSAWLQQSQRTSANGTAMTDPDFLVRRSDLALLVPDHHCECRRPCWATVPQFFTANIRNANTRAAYARAIGAFCAWLDERGIALERVEPMIVAAYVQHLGRSRSAPTVKQALAAGSACCSTGLLSARSCR